jgi:hypothetical protein
MISVYQVGNKPRLNLLSPLLFHKNVHYKVAASRRVILQRGGLLSRGKRGSSSIQGWEWNLSLVHIRFEDAGLLTILYLEIS